MEAPPLPGHVMALDDAADDLQPTQIDQPTQPLSQESSKPAPPETYLWGFLIPCNPAMETLKFSRKSPVVRIGRNASKEVGNHIVLKGLKISSVFPSFNASLPYFDASLLGNRHCEIKWDGNDSRKAVITVADFSSNGTFVCSFSR